MDASIGFEEISGELTGAFGARLLTGSALERYGVSEGPHAGHLPKAVVQPRTVEEVQRIMVLAQAHHVPITPFGAGTSLEGNAAAARGGLCIDLMLMDRILEIAPEDLLCVVEPGVTRERLNVELRNTGLFFPIDPGANASLGGMIATRASGTNAVRYGTMRENTLALKVVLPDGRLVKTGTRARKSSAGYDLTHLFVGSEGTLGVTVEATLRLYGIPETVLAGVWPFKTLEGAVATVIAAVQSGLPLARIELLDPAAIRACNLYSKLDLAAAPTLFVELHGSPGAVAEQRALLEAIGEAEGGGLLDMSADADAQRRLWKARHQALPAARALVPGAVTWITDVCVPISKLADAIAQAQAAVNQAGLLAPILGHVGDGNFHIFFVLDPHQPEQWLAAERVSAAVIDHALSVGGTCTGEHGIGLGKREALLQEHGAVAVEVMRSLKGTLDPKGLMNPDKIFPEIGP
jgi:D-lactate dehydrogenase (cytochrome)